MVVWDGMRPDFVSEQTTPALYRLAQQGVKFANHHPVYPSITEVNGVALNTGLYPGLSGIVGNNEYRPSINPTGKVMTGAADTVRRGDRVSGEHFLERATLAETLHKHRFATAIAGTKSVTVLFDRHAADEGGAGIDMFEGSVVPEGFRGGLEKELGSFPPAAIPKRARDVWTTEALLGPFWKGDLPAFSVLWLGEPDYTQHKTGPGSRLSLEAIRAADERLAQVLGEIDRRGAQGRTDVIVVSDHGFSTAIKNVDVAAVLRENGFQAMREFPANGAKEDDILTVGNSGTVFLYVAGHRQALVDKLTHCLQSQPFCGVVFSRQPVEGALGLETVKIQSPNAPDVVLAMRWTAEKSTNGTPGVLYGDIGEYGPGQGIHGSLSPFDMHNTCVAAGPDFRRGFEDQIPTGNVDITPTILWILGVEPQQKLSGRVIREALATFGSGGEAPQPKSHRLETSYRGEKFAWRQYLDYSEVDGVIYFTEGNGEQLPRDNVAVEGNAQRKAAR
jgi:arylsulfatase A-like enzyme